MWRPAEPRDDDDLIALSVALNAEDPGPAPVPAEHVRRTLATLRAAPSRGTALVLEVDGRPAGYAFLIGFLSNELGGDVCVIDELYVAPAHRGHGHATRLLDDLATGAAPYAAGAVALALETTPGNAAARRLYERVGFRARNLAMRRLLPR
ncbi:MAG: GNAT family N-acetyltransferase [Candidatus Accumulibacter meliphilus]|jgi:GNAT superfamily N-acetyltransferase|uniref:GNAT family N-acetyltransferase n=1 Tax=Candidatus Accumulibacter meliphilus TaxID=2211374 RepID=UPI001B48523C|nr:GNAT family N-acetyltransferase [Kofleriaceae bacterium]MBP9171285.1 GNAT family N-acetyltransferase [Kofleriaceae bacterium]MBP9861571.1 GNAT family N-acetyltransferase [Kofleriaceae bacterium]